MASGKLDRYVTVNGKELRCGFTTGTCASAATSAAVASLLSGHDIESVDVRLPDGKSISVRIEGTVREKGAVTCSVRKDGGDDIDATHGMLIRSTVSARNDRSIVIDGGIGIGRVTLNGLDQPVGNAAINSVPRSMIAASAADAASKFGCSKGFDVVISAPEGIVRAERTFNSRLGIIGGISILGTSGIVEPMSEKAIVDTIKAEMNVKFASGRRYLLVVPGNYGMDYSEKEMGIDVSDAIKCSNFIGETLDHACNIGVRGILLVGNAGKLVKLAGGIMNTHSRYADCRMEILASDAIMAGADLETAKKIMSAVTTDDAFDILDRKGILGQTMSEMMKHIVYHLGHRIGGRMDAEVVVFSSKYGKLCETDGVDDMMKKIKEGA